MTKRTKQSEETQVTDMDLAARVEGRVDQWGHEPVLPDPRNTGLWDLVKGKVSLISEEIAEDCLDNSYAPECRQLIRILDGILANAEGTEPDLEGDNYCLGCQRVGTASNPCVCPPDDSGDEPNATMLDDLGHAGQPGYVARKGDRVLVVPATNVPNGGYHIVYGDHSIHVAQLDGIAELDSAYAQYLAETTDNRKDQLVLNEDRRYQETQMVEPTSKQCGDKPSLHVLAQEALDIQNACNLSGLSLRFAEVMQELRVALESCNMLADSNALHSHCITRLWVSKLHDVARMGLSEQDRYSCAYHEAQALAAF